MGYDAKYYNGDQDDPREFGPAPGSEDCADCGVGPLANCLWWCACPVCLLGKPLQKPAGEAA